RIIGIEIRPGLSLPDEIEVQPAESDHDNRNGDFPQYSEPQEKPPQSAKRNGNQAGKRRDETPKEGKNALYCIPHRKNILPLAQKSGLRTAFAVAHRPMHRKSRSQAAKPEKASD